MFKFWIILIKGPIVGASTVFVFRRLECKVLAFLCMFFAQLSKDGILHDSSCVFYFFLSFQLVNLTESEMSSNGPLKLPCLRSEAADAVNKCCFSPGAAGSAGLMHFDIALLDIISIRISFYIVTVLIYCIYPN